MAPLPSSNRTFVVSAPSVIAFALTLGACESTPANPVGGAGTTVASAGQSGAGAPGAPTSMGGQSTTGSQSSTGAQNTSAGQSSTGTATPMGGQTAGGGAGQTAGAPSGGGGGGGVAPTAGAANGGTSGVGSGGESTGGAGGSGGSGGGGTFNGECTREFLDSMLDAYFTALAAGDPSSLPLAENVKFTENAQESEIGSTDFWMDAGDVVHSQAALDTTACSVAAQAVVPEGSTDLPIAIRIKLEGGEMTEIETIVVRQGDYTASFAVDNDTGAIIDIADDIGWHDPVPEADRFSREDMAAWVENYFRAFPNGVCDTTGDCIRLENGGGNFSCGNSCSGGSGGFEPRVTVVDEERGIATGFTVFDFMTVGHLDMHMVKMYGGQVHAVHAILRDTGGESGWD